MKVKVSYYVVALVAGFVYALAKYYVPSLPLTEDAVLWFILAILAALNIDVVRAFKATEARLNSLIANLRGRDLL